MNTTLTEQVGSELAALRDAADVQALPDARVAQGPVVQMAGAAR